MSVLFESVRVPADGAGLHPPTKFLAKGAITGAIDAAFGAADSGARIVDGCDHLLVQRNRSRREINYGGGRSANRS
jgi:hypothetical protein